MDKRPPFSPDALFALLKGRVAEAELYQQTGESRPVLFKAGKLHSAEANISCSAGLRVVVEGRVGFASGNDPENLASLAERALASARFGEKAAFSLPASCTAHFAVQTVDTGVPALTIEQKIAHGKSVLERLAPESRGLSVDLETQTSESTDFLNNTHGLALSSQRTVYSFGYSALKVDANGLLWLSEGNSSCRVDNRTDKQVARTLFLLEKASRVVPAKNPRIIIVEPAVLSSLVAAFTTAISGKTVFKGTSPLSGKLGQSITDPRFSLFEDPSLDYRTASVVFDDEGVPAAKKALIENGVLKSFIYDLQTAGLSNALPTGNGFRGTGSLPAPGYCNLVIPCGSKSTEQIVRETKDGLWIHSVLGSGQSNMLAGDFSLNAHLAFKIENGGITGRVKDTMISGNVYDLFRKITEISSDTDDSSGSTIYPAMAFEGVSVTG
ncbi:MAG: TldD/PmbA family protein [Fibrobacterota bacterium]